MLHDHFNFIVLSTAATSAANSAVFAMSEQVQIYIVGTAATLIGTGFTAWLAYKAKRYSEDAVKISKESKDLSQESKDVAVATGAAVNGKMEEFKKMAEVFFHAKGVADEKAAAELKSAVEAKATLAERDRIAVPVVTAP